MGSNRILLRNDSLKWNLPCFNNKSTDYIDFFIEKLFAVDEINPVSYISGGNKCKWNMNKNFLSMDITYLKIPRVCSRGKSVLVFDFSFYDIKDEDLNDYKSNFLLDYVMSVNGAFEVSSDKLYSYIKKRYPESKIFASVVKSDFELEEGKETDFYNRLLDKYDMVTLSPKYVKHKFLKDAEKINDHSRLEIIVNENKIFDCPCADEYNHFIEGNLRQKSNDLLNYDLKMLFENSVALSTDEIDKISDETDVNNFRIISYNIKYQESLSLIHNYLLNRYGVSSFFIYYVGDSNEK